jgi:hypothetical protein
VITDFVALSAHGPTLSRCAVKLTATCLLTLASPWSSLPPHAGRALIAKLWRYRITWVRWFSDDRLPAPGPSGIDQVLNPLGSLGSRCASLEDSERAMALRL